MDPTRPFPLPLYDEKQLVSVFHRGAKERAARRIGVEQEKIGVLPGGLPIPYEGENGIGVLLDEWAEQFGYKPVKEDGATIALDGEAGAITLEPGGQLEFSGSPVATLADVRAQLAKHAGELEVLSEKLNLSWLTTGFRPFGHLDDVPWMPKGRYRVMRAYMPTRGALGHEMMKRTATVQVSLDYENLDDAAAKMRTSMALGAIVTAMCANSPIVDGRPSGYQSYRAAVWLDTDNERCGLLPFVFSPKRDLFTDYAEWAIDLPMYFVYREGKYIPAQGMTFRRFMHHGFGQERPNMADWELHLSTVFPEVRLKNYLELRGADAGPSGLGVALAALWTGLLYDDASLKAAWKLVSGLSFSERVALAAQVPRHGLEAKVGLRNVRDVARDLVVLAREGLVRQGMSTDGAQKELELFEGIAMTGRTLADELVGEWNAVQGDPARLVPWLDFFNGAR